MSDGSGYCTAHKRPASGSFADKDRGTRHQRGYGSKWDRLREIILRRDNGLCQQCLREGCVTMIGHKPYTAFVDHVIPKAEGGTDDESNLQALCKSCHTAKTDREKNRGRGASNL